MKLNGMPCIVADDILLFDPGGGLKNWANTISGSFTYPSGQTPCSIMINKGKDICSTSCHGWLGFPETVLYRYTDGTFGIGKFITTSQIPKRKDVLWAVGGMGLLDKYNPAEEGFSKFTKNGKAYNYTDVLRLTSHTLIGVKDNKIYLIYVPSMTGPQVNAYATKCGFDSAVMLDGGHISAIHSEEHKINLTTVQGYAIQGLIAKTAPTVKKKIILDPGHSPLVKGKESPDGTYKEYEFNLDISNRMQKLLSQYPLNTVIVDYSHANANTELVTLIKKINGENADICVSLHSNAFGTDFNSANGWEIFTYKMQGESLRLAQAIHGEINPLGLTDRGIKDGSHLAVIRDTTMPCVLIETGFHTNKDDLAKLKDNAFRDKVADAYVKGILRYFGIEPINAPVKEPLTTTIYKVQAGSFVNKSSAEALIVKLKSLGIDAYIQEVTK